MAVFKSSLHQAKLRNRLHDKTLDTLLSSCILWQHASVYEKVSTFSYTLACCHSMHEESRVSRVLSWRRLRSFVHSIPAAAVFSFVLQSLHCADCPSFSLRKMLQTPSFLYSTKSPLLDNRYLETVTMDYRLTGPWAEQGQPKWTLV